MEKLNKEKEIKTIGKNIIYNHFKSTCFVNNLNYLHVNNKNFSKPLNYNFKIIDKPSICEEGVKSGDKKNSHKNGHKKFIMHLVPSKKSNFYKYLNERKEIVLKKYGKDEIYKYDVHISLTGYFFCDNISIFLNALFIYILNYAKTYYMFKNSSINHVFFKICHDSRYRNIFIIKKNHDSEEKEKTFKIDKSRHNKTVSNEIKEDNNVEYRVLTTNDGYVIIPIACEWINIFFENFSFLIKNNKFRSLNKTNDVNKMKNSCLYKNLLISKGFREKHINDHKLHANVLSLKGAYQQNANSPNIEFENDVVKDIGSNNENGSNQMIDSYNNKNIVVTSDHYHINYKTNIINNNNSNNYYQKIKTLKKCTKIYNIDKKSSNNKITHKYNNMDVELSQFRIKKCSHISLSSNRTDKQIQKYIAHEYKDLKYHFGGCLWDMVMYQYDESFLPQDQYKNNFLIEVFRFKNFAVS